MSGTIALFQGFPCHSVDYRNTRGFGASLSAVDIVVASGTRIRPPRPGETIIIPPRPGRRDALGFLRATGSRPPVVAVAIEWVGFLQLGEIDSAGREFGEVYGPFFVLGHSTARQSEDGKERIRLTLADKRFLFDRGVLRLWSFNRMGPDGRATTDSTRGFGRPWTLSEVAREEIVPRLHGAPALVDYPPEWDGVRSQQEFPHHASAIEALGELVKEHGLLPPCLNHDGSIGLFRGSGVGEGRVGFSPDGSPGNSEPLPPELLLWKGGTGQGSSSDLGWPPTFLFVVGEARIATVVVDEWEPVLVIKGEVFKLDETNIRKVTDGKYGIDWLKRIVRTPQAYQSVPGISPALAELLAAQGFKLWRLPFVEIDDPGGSVDDKGTPIQVPGPNANLLPLIHTAETVAGKRVAPFVETFSTISVHVTLGESENQEALRNAKLALAVLKKNIRRVAEQDFPSAGDFLGAPGSRPFDPFDPSSFEDERFTPDIIGDLFAGSNFDVTSSSEFNSLLETARTIGRIEKKTRPDLAAAFADATKRRLAAQDAVTGKNDSELFDLAQQTIELEKLIREKGDLEDDKADILSDFAGSIAEFREKIKAAIRAIDRAGKAAERRSATGARRPQQQDEQLVLKNAAREVDAGARVFDAELGIVQVSVLPGHVDNERATVFDATTFIPKPVKVTFGAKIRPRLDRPLSQLVTGPSGVKRSPEDVVPEVLTDEDSFFLRVFRRTQGAAFERVKFGAIKDDRAREIIRQQAVKIRRPDLYQLVPLEGEGNLGELARVTEDLARSQFARPDVLGERLATIARPLLINPDATISGVSIILRSGGRGFEVRITTGETAHEIEPMRTRVRPRGRQDPRTDGADRSGVSGR